MLSFSPLALSSTIFYSGGTSGKCAATKAQFSSKTTQRLHQRRAPQYGPYSPLSGWPI